MTPFHAIIVDKHQEQVSASLREVGEEALKRTGERDVLVRVRYSTINYKDGLAVTGRSPIIRSFPMIPGIDFAGTVEESEDPLFQPGDEVILNGWGVGETHPGGLAQMARVKGDWLIHRPASISARQSMAIGTAGYTAMLCILALEKHGVQPGDGEVLVTGAAGGVGSIATAVLARLGYRVVASTGRPQESAYLTSLGASAIMDRAELSAPGKPLGRERWAGVVDSVGSHTLANACATTRANGAVTACGLAQGMDFPASVAPFILRGVALYGINSVLNPRSQREQAWNRLARDLDSALLESMTQEIALGQVIGVAEQILAGHVRGRTVVDVNRI